MALLGPLVLAGCSLLQTQPYLERRDWPLVVRRPETLLPAPRGPVLLVRSVRAAPDLAARGLQWLQKDGSVHVDFYEQWAVQPASAVDDDLRQWLAASGRYSAVLSPGSRMNADLVLEGELNALVADPPSGNARVSLSLVLLDQRSGVAKVKLQRTVTAQAQLAGSGVPEMVDAMRAALADVLQQTEAVLGEVRG
jgi:ABC-type uncharacterized transport system auxiliary subunit